MPDTGVVAAAVVTKEGEQELSVRSTETQRVEDAFVDALSEAIIAKLKRAAAGPRKNSSGESDGAAT